MQQVFQIFDSLKVTAAGYDQIPAWYQFAFRPTGSTTAAIIDLLQQTSNMLLNNDFVVIVSTDFSKAFDTVSHQALFDKMGSLDLPDEIYNWMVSYYSNRSYVTRYLGSTSGVALIHRRCFGPPSKTRMQRNSQVCRRHVSSCRL